MDSVPGKAACSPLAPMAKAGASATPERPAHARWATATAILVSVSSGRCGPCCSSEPTGTTSSRRGPCSISGHRIRASSQAGSDAGMPPCYVPSSLFPRTVRKIIIECQHDDTMAR
jgi:hypothetical protein